MDTEIRPADAEGLERAATLIRSGRLVAFPTETVYGLGAHALDAAAVQAIFRAKGRPATNPLIVHVRSVEQASTVVAQWPESAQKLASVFWPGPLTLVLPRRPIVPDLVTAGGPTVAVRCPAHPVAQALLERAGVPIAAPSANRSGELSPTTAAHVAASLLGRVDLILDGGPSQVGVESTVLDLSEPAPRILRPGHITRGDLQFVLGPQPQVHLGPDPNRSGPLASPGLLTRHYAPRTALECVEQEADLAFLTQVYETAGLTVTHWIPQGSPMEVSARLYADLHTLDASGFDRILAVLPPDTDDWQAIRDRLTRAAAEPTE